MHKLLRVSSAFALALLTVGVCTALPASGGSGKAEPAAAAVARHWTAERRAQAVPRDLVLDQRGLGYLRLPSGALKPYGHSTPAPKAKPGNGDKTPPAISGMDPSGGQTIGSSYAFRATVTDASGVQSVSFVITYPDGVTTQSFNAAAGANNVWSTTLQGFSDGSWNWRVVAKDKAKPGNTATSSTVSFTVGSGGGGGGGNVVTNAEWTSDGALQTAIGRIYFEMPANSQQTRWTGYVCSGTAVTDAANVSVILTAAHCVYDDANKAFARNVLFIPNQADTTGSGTDLTCSNDPLGCWAPSHGVVDSDWSSRTWPSNIPWDYAYYVVPIAGAHSGATASSDSLEEAAGTLGIRFSPAPTVGALTHALGYSYDQDPKLMYCAEDLGTEGSANWWLSQRDLSGGSSGGAWIQPLQGGSGPVISVNSWGYTNSPGMAGPKLSGTSASCLLAAAQTNATNATRGLIPNC